VLSVCPSQLQAELTNLLPEVASDNHHRYNHHVVCISGCCAHTQSLTTQLC
jgi:hypothetical protein